VPPLLKMIGATTLSTRATASLLEVERSIRTWPQLGSAVMFGGGLGADAVRRVLLGELRKSGRFYCDLSTLLRDELNALAVPARARREGTPKSAITSDVVRHLVARATLAPSGGNHQPWQWTAHGNHLVLRDDPAHAPS
jgi:hypothetical protein